MRADAAQKRTKCANCSAAYVVVSQRERSLIPEQLIRIARDSHGRLLITLREPSGGSLELAAEMEVCPTCRRKVFELIPLAPPPNA